MLTNQEKQVALLISEGLTNNEIAKRLFLSPGTVRNYVSACLSKLYLTSRAQLAIWAHKNDIRSSVAKIDKQPTDPDTYKDLLFGVYR